MKTVLLLILGACAMEAQTPSFEVASIKPNQTGAGPSSIRGSAGRLTMENVTLRKATLWAYGIPDDREYALAGPGWLGIERFDIQATFSATATPDSVRQMAQGLLAERFGLAMHRENREHTVYALIVAKGGPKIHPVGDGESRTSNSPGKFEAAKISMRKFADLLGRFLSQPVIDATDLAGVFDFQLTYAPETAGKVPDDAVAETDSGPSLTTALQEQLGLRLESRKGTVDVLVVDHVERTPTAN